MDPARTPGLKDRTGNALALRSDGTRTNPVAPINLFVDAFKGIDAAFATYQTDHPNDAGRQDGWRGARSAFTDTFLSVHGKADKAQFANQTLIALLPSALDLVRAQSSRTARPPAPLATGRSKGSCRASRTR